MKRKIAITVGVAWVFTMGHICNAQTTATEKKVFESNCAVCHMPGATGVAGIFPHLADSIGRYLSVPGGRSYLAHVPCFGLTGPIKSHGEEIDNTMPALDFLHDGEIADALNYVLTNFNAKLLPKNFKPYTAADIKRYRAHHMSMEAVHAEREKLMTRLAKRQTPALPDPSARPAPKAPERSISPSGSAARQGGAGSAETR